MKAIASLYNYRLLANTSSTPTPKIPKVGGTILGLGDLNNVAIKPISGALKWSYSQNFFFPYLNERPFLTQSLTPLSNPGMCNAWLTQVVCIGACRALGVPRQDLATPHLMRYCRKRM